jgi:hypothetical protein
VIGSMENNHVSFGLGRAVSRASGSPFSAGMGESGVAGVERGREGQGEGSPARR